jgi:glycosyltransferase involved in cell wall biosynthesis
MKIVFLCRLFYPHIGGVERHVLEVSQILIKQGHSVTVITEKHAANLKGKEEIHGIHVRRISVGGEDWFKKFRVWKAIWNLRGVIKGADVVHAHDVMFWYIPFRFLFWNKPVFTTFHGYETVFPVSQRAIFVRKISEKLSRGNIVVGDFIKKWYGTKSDFVIYGGVNINPLDFTQGKKSKLKIAFIGRLDADTGFIFFRQVVELLKNKNISFDFDMYGDGELKKIAAKVGTVHGFVSTIEKEIAKADIIFASSYLSILESMAQHKLVFSTYSNPLKEDYLKMTPFAKFIIIENDPEKLAEKIDYYIHNSKEQKEMIENAYTWVVKQTWEKITEDYLRLWN